MRLRLLMEEYQNIPPRNLKQLNVAYETAHCLDYSSDISIADIRALVILLDRGRRMDPGRTGLLSSVSGLHPLDRTPQCDNQKYIRRYQMAP